MPRSAHLVFAFLLVASATAQDKPVIAPMDKATGQSLVDTLTKENESLQAEGDRLKTEVSGLIDRITAAKKWTDDLSPLLDEVRARSGELYTLIAAIADRTLKTRAQAGLDANIAEEKRLMARLDELSALVVALGKQIETRRFQAAVDDAKIARNNDDIVLLQAALAKTRLQEEALQRLLNKVQTLSARVESFLTQSAVAR